MSGLVLLFVCFAHPQGVRDGISYSSLVVPALSWHRCGVFMPPMPATMVSALFTSSLACGYIPPPFIEVCCVFVLLII